MNPEEFKKMEEVNKAIRHAQTGKDILVDVNVSINPAENNQKYIVETYEVKGGVDDGYRYNSFVKVMDYIKKQEAFRSYVKMINLFTEQARTNFKAELRLRRIKRLENKIKIRKRKIQRKVCILILKYIAIICWIIFFVLLVIGLMKG